QRGGLDRSGGAVGHQGQGLRGADLEVDAGPADPHGTRDGDVGALVADADLGQRLLDRQRGGPDGLFDAVDGRGDLAAVPDGDLGAVLDRAVEGGHDLVVLAELDALVGQNV